MRLFYTVAYGLGFKPWETASKKEAQRIAELFDREETDRKRPFGKALDLGCGTGMHAIELARRGWQVTGIDLVPKALREARKRAQRRVRTSLSSAPTSPISAAPALVWTSILHWTLVCFTA
jgi:SAM-dependent methyltransferase